MQLHFFLRLLTVVLLFNTYSAFALSSAEVFKNVEPRVVLIGNVEGFGSGVMVSADGLVLTNYHVVNSALPLTVKAKVKSGNSYVEKEFRKVTVYKVHKQYDLALLKIEDSKGATFPFLRLEKKLVPTGATCYVIGNPDGGDGQALRNSITVGLISSNERRLENLKYLQISAAVNPGNSGGTVVNTKGELIGVVTFKASEAEGIGFAIPCSEIDPSDFVLKSEKNNRELGIYYQNKGNEYYDLWTQSSETKKEYLYKALELYKLSLNELPNETSAFYGVGMAYCTLDEYTLAIPYLKKALEVDPDNGLAFFVLGWIAQVKDDMEKALQFWHEGMFSKNRNGSLKCIEHLVATYAKTEKSLEAAYLTKYYLLLKQNSASNQDKKFFEELLGKLDPGIVTFINDKKDISEFSREEFDSLGRKINKILARQKKEREQIEKLQAEELAHFKRVFESRIAKIPKLNGWVTKKMPGTVTNIIPVFGGAYLAVSTKELKRVILFDTLSGKSVKYLPVASNDFLMAAANDKLFVYHPHMKICEIFSLISMKKEQAKRLKDEVVISLFEMGMNNSSQAFISYCEKTEELSPRRYGLLDLRNMVITPLTPALSKGSNYRSQNFRNSHYRDLVHATVNKDLSEVAMWCTSHSPNGFELVLINKENNTFENSYEHSGFGSLGISSTGSHIYTTSGWAFEKGNKKLKHFQGSNLFRVLDANFFIELNVETKEIHVRESFSQTSLIKHNLPFDLKWPNHYEKVDLQKYQYVIASGLVNRLTIFDRVANEFYVCELLQDGMVKGEGSATVNNMTTKAGEVWKYNLLLPKGFSGRLEDGPSGMVLNNGELSWTVPADISQGVVEILVSQRDPQGDENYRILKLLVQ